MRRLVVTTALVACGAALFGCGKKSPDTAVPDMRIPDVAPGSTQASPPPTGTPEELEAQSSLSLKRGVVTLTAQSRGIRLCGAKADLTLLDQLDGALDRVYQDLGGKPVYVEVYGEQVTPDADTKTSGFNVEELLYATSTDPSAACAAAAGAYELQARGSEPTWSIEVKGDTLVFKQTRAPTEIKFTGVETADTEGTVTYRAGADRHVLELVVTQRPCHDSTMHEYYAYTANVRLDKQMLSGCARVGE